MELQFHKEMIPCLQKITREIQNQEQTQEVRLTDGMPDIGRVLASWGQILIRSKEWRSGGAGVSGGVMVWVLYAPEDGTEPQSVETWLPFQMKWDFPDTGRDGTINVIPYLRSVDARSVSARKLMIRAGIGMLGHAMAPTEIELYKPSEIPEDVQMLTNRYPVQLPKEAGEKAFNIEDALSLPSSAFNVGKLVHYSLHPELTDSKVMADKLIMRGIAHLNVFYIGNDGQLHTWKSELPFSQYAELDREYDTNAQARIDLAVTALELEQGEEENLNLKAGLTGQYVIYDRPVIEVVEDAYSPNRSVTPQMSALKMPALLDSRTETLYAEQSAENDIDRPAEIVFYADQPQLYSDGDHLTAELAGNFQMLGYDADGQLQGATVRWQGEWSTVSARDAGAEMTLLAADALETVPVSGNAQLRGEMTVRMDTVSEQGIPMVTGLEVGELHTPDPARPSLILTRVGAESLWDVAKRTGSTVEAIKKANDLQQEPENNRVLLIPVP